MTPWIQILAGAALAIAFLVLLVCFHERGYQRGWRKGYHEGDEVGYSRGRLEADN